MERSGWHKYIYDDVRWQSVHTIAMQAMQIGAVLRHAFRRNTDGSLIVIVTFNE